MIKIYEDSGIVTFVCDGCYSMDTTYNGSPKFCWNCSKPYPADIELLMKYRQERRHYHFNGRTSDRDA